MGGVIALQSRRNRDERGERHSEERKAKRPQYGMTLSPP